MTTIRGVFDIPTYYNDLSFDVSSRNIHSLLKTNPIEYMRTLFIDDNRKFYSLRDELILRGIGFKEEFQNNYLLGIDYQIHFIIIKTENTDSFKKINFSMHGATNFIERFQVNSDLFFHNVPWEGILHFIPNASPDILKKNFLAAGFSIVPVEVYQAISPTEPATNDSGKDRGVFIAKESSEYNYSKLDLPVEYYYEEVTFNHFINYCQKNNIKKFSELTLDNIKDYANQKFTRSKTLQLIEEKYHDINKQYNPLPYNFSETLDLLQDNPFKRICEIADVDYLELLDAFYKNDNLYEDVFNIEVIEQFCDYTINNIEEIIKKKEKSRKQEQLQLLVHKINNHPNYKYILSISIQTLTKILSFNNVQLPNEELYLYDILEDMNYLTFLEQILISLNRLVELRGIVQTLIGYLNERQKEVITLRESMTLHEVGEIIGVTRERVRQIEAKVNRIIKQYIEEFKIEIYFLFYTEHSKLVSIDDFCDAFNISGSLERIIIKKILSHTNIAHFVESIQRYMNIEDYELIADSLDKVDFYQSIIKVDHLKQIIPIEIINEMQEVIDMVIRSQGYFRVNNIYVREKISIKDRINYLFDNHITTPLYMDGEGYEYFKDLISSVFGIPYESTKRSATARIADGDNVILVDSNTFFRHEREKITDDLLNYLETTIDDMLSTHPYADPRIIYNENPNLVEDASLYSPVHLYSIIQLYLGDKYETGHRNTLYIYKSNTNVINSEDILCDYLSKNGHEVPYHKVLEDLNWKAPKLDQLLARIDSVITVKDKTIKTIESFEFKDEELNELKSTVEQEFKKGYIFTEDLAFELAFNPKLEQLVKRTGLADITTLSSIVKFLYKDASGFSRMLYNADSSIKSLEQALAKEFPEMMTRADLIKFTLEKGYSEQKLAAVPSTIVEDGLFYPYTSTQYINANIVHFKEDTKKSLQEYLDKLFADKSYRSMFSALRYSQELLPISTYNWTEWLIHHFAEQVGYRKIIVYNQDYRYDKLLLVKEDSQISTLSELVYYIAKTHYKDRAHEEDFAKYLAADNIIYNPRRLSNEIYKSKYFEFDNFGFYRLR
jgi:hypothetical protein